MDTQAYRSGIEALREQDYKAAERAFRLALDSCDEISDAAGNSQYNRIQSYYGLVQVLNANDNGLLVCRDAASRELRDGDVFLNLAAAELESDNRKRAIEAIQHGMKIEPNNARLQRACARLDCRKKCCFGFLSREHTLNRFFGRLKRRTRTDQVLSVHSLLY
jgi:hypothetical protein